MAFMMDVQNAKINRLSLDGKNFTEWLVTNEQKNMDIDKYIECYIRPALMVLKNYKPK